MKGTVVKDALSGMERYEELFRFAVCSYGCESHHALPLVFGISVEMSRVCVFLRFQIAAVACTLVTLTSTR